MVTMTPRTRALAAGASLLALAACGGGGEPFDWDLRRTGATLDTSAAALNVTGARPAPDARGVLSYPGYQVAVGRAGDTVATVAQRVGLPAEELARANALQPGDPVRDGEVLALPRRIAAAPGLPATGPGAVIGAPVRTTGIDVTTLASGAIDRAQPSSPTAIAAPAAPAGAEPLRHTVVRGETAFSIARSYSVSARALADWNGLGPDLSVREGQTLLIPVGTAPAPAREADATPPGAGSPTPTPPSASQPLPDEDVAPAAAEPERPASPDLGETRTEASAAQFAMPAQGAIIRGFGPPNSLGIDIGAPAGSPVVAAEAGTVAAITQDTDGNSIVILRHPENILTVYGGVDAITVKKDDRVTRGQAFAKVRAADPAFLHFEVRKGFDAVDPMPYLQ